MIWFILSMGLCDLRHAFHAPNGSTARFRSDFGAMLVEASEDKVIFQFFTRQRELIDEYTLWKAGR
jgi:hypothetical protein